MKDVSAPGGGGLHGRTGNNGMAAWKAALGQALPRTFCRPCSCTGSSPPFFCLSVSSQLVLPLSVASQPTATQPETWAKRQQAPSPLRPGPGHMVTWGGLVAAATNPHCTSATRTPTLRSPLTTVHTAQLQRRGSWTMINCCCAAIASHAHHGRLRKQPSSNAPRRLYGMRETQWNVTTASPFWRRQEAETLRCLGAPEGCMRSPESHAITPAADLARLQAPRRPGSTTRPAARR